MSKYNILAFVKDSDWGIKVEEFLDVIGHNVKVYRGSRGDRFPIVEKNGDIDILISFSSQWIIPKCLLDIVKVCSINFHPGSPDYPGIGCTNFAIYNQEEKFGVTCHHMDSTVDTGKIIATKYFPLFKEDSVLSLTQRTYGYLFSLFVETMGSLLYKGHISESKDRWSRKPYTRKELNDLCNLTIDMDKKEIEKRIKATTYPNMQGATLNYSGYKFNLDDKVFYKYE